MPNLIEIQAALINFSTLSGIPLEEPSALGRFASKAERVISNIDNSNNSASIYVFACIGFACLVSAIALSVYIPDKKKLAQKQFDVVKDATCDYNNGTMGGRDFSDLCVTYRSRNTEAYYGSPDFKKQWQDFIIACCNATLTNQTGCDDTAYAESGQFCRDYLPFFYFTVGAVCFGFVAIAALCFAKGTYKRALASSYTSIETSQTTAKEVDLSVSQSTQLSQIFSDIRAFQFASSEDIEAFGGQLTSLKSLVEKVTLTETEGERKLVSTEALRNIYRALKILTGHKEACCNLWSLKLGNSSSSAAVNEGRPLAVRPGNGGVN